MLAHFLKKGKHLGNVTCRRATLVEPTDEQPPEEGVLGGVAELNHVVEERVFVPLEKAVDVIGHVAGVVLENELWSCASGSWWLNGSGPREWQLVFEH